MGLFSRKGNSHQRQDDGNHRDGQLARNTSIPSKASFGIRRANSTPAESLNLASIPLPKAPDPHIDPVGYLKSIYAIRERSLLVLKRAKADRLRHFDVDMSKFGDTVRFVVSIIKVNSPTPGLCKWRAQIGLISPSATSSLVISRYHQTANGNNFKEKVKQDSIN